MKNCIPLICLAFGVSLNSHAALVFTEDFESPFSIDFTTTGTTAFGGATPNVVVGEWFSSTQTVNTGNGVLGFGSLNTNNRGRGAGVWLDTTSWDVGTVTVSFEISNYTGDASATPFYQAYSATGVGATGSVSFDLHTGSGFSEPTVSGTAATGSIGPRNTINGDDNYAFTFDYTGAEENIALIFFNRDGPATAQPTFSLDNLSVNTVPEPSTATLLLGMAAAGLFYRGKRHRQGFQD